MKIIILGAGEVGSVLAEYLVADKHNYITVVDNQQEKLQQLEERYDLRTIFGHASHPSILDNAGAKDADMLVAVTNSDETNMVACQIAYSLFNTPNRIARIRTSEYIKYNDVSLFTPDIIPIDNIIAPEALVTAQLYQLIQYPGALQIVMFCEDKIALVVVTAYYGGLLIGEELVEIKNHIPYVNAKIVAIFRHGKTIRLQDSTVIEAGDEIIFLVETDYIKSVISEFQRLEKDYKSIMIAGGGTIGAALAVKLEEDGYQVKVIERNENRANYIAQSLQNSIVLHGEASEQELLQEENIDQTDVFVAVTNDDAANIMSAILAKKLGAQKTIVLIQKQAYVNLIQQESIDIIVSPQQITISALLNHVRRGDIVKVASLRQGLAEAIEIIAHGDTESSKIVGKPIAEIRLPASTTIGAIIRGEDIMIASNELVIEEGDHIIMFLPNKNSITEIEKLFQPNASFL